MNAGVGRGRDDLHKVVPQSSAVARQGAREGTGWKGDTPGIVHTMPGSIAQGAGCIDPTHPKKGQSWSLYVRLTKLKQCTVKCPPKYGI